MFFIDLSSISMFDDESGNRLIKSLIDLLIFSKRTLSFATSERELAPLITDIYLVYLNLGKRINSQPNLLALRFSAELA